MQRKAYKDLMNWKIGGMSKPLMVTGARQVGKTYLIEEFCRNEFADFVEFNLFYDKNIVEIFERNSSIKDRIELLKLSIKMLKGDTFDYSNSIIFIDEIQECEEAILSLKYFAESSEKFNIIVAGSLLGVKLKRMNKAFPVGKVDMIQMRSLDIEEFINAIYGNDMIEKIKECFLKDMPINPTIHEMLLETYKIYLCIGGMPEAVKYYIDNKSIGSFNNSILENIKIGYVFDMRKYVKDPSESVRIENIYNSIAIQIGNKSNKFQYSKVNKTARAVNYETAMQWLDSSSMVHKIYCVNPPKMPLEMHKDDNTFKLYINDVGLLTLAMKIKFMDIINNTDFTEKGILVENFVLQQLISQNNDVYYWKDESYSEIDFLIYTNDGIIPIETKSGTNVRSSSLKKYMKSYNPKYGIRISAKNFGFENNIKSVPLYASFMITDK